jgi:L-alanine-DL-glutamate epimerase-like enolase superfamily enzyme
MKIKSLRVWIEHLPLTKPYTIAYKIIEDTEIVFLEILLENGVVGMGASNPFEDVIGETPQQTLLNLKDDYLQSFVGRDINDYNNLIDEAILHFPTMPGTVAAIDIALHDAFCRLKGIRIVDLFGQKVDGLLTSVTIGIKDLDQMMDDAKAYLAQGFKIIKIKTGIEVEEDIERVSRLSEAFKRKLLIRVDANQGYDIDQLQHFLIKTKHLDIELIEQPLQVGADINLLKCTQEERKIFVADESLIDLASAIQLCKNPAPYGVFNVKLMKCGGIKNARKIAQIAKQAGIDLFWGCNDESNVSIAAALHVAYSCENTKYLDLDGSFDLAYDLKQSGFVVKEGRMYCTD